MPNAVRFLFTGDSLPKIIVNTVQVEDVQPGGPAADPPPGSMRVEFRQSDPGPAQAVHPLLPGTMQFLVDAAAPGTTRIRRRVRSRKTMSLTGKHAAGSW